ncbi:MAG: WecB/TagA/CpsF family glycosyltransferase [Candidatus Shapirobacteria bacterium]|nr:WecB/TagA/CpsF family glycosyltransferase [Candidatus Shapirobacteria bacterium]MDD5073881.1 WecB/TagA/CpsF family glycosyltransferase [Candidatus Shapirobacteria bacterium]MDD5481474.1 WecB/TagA/CpsF family glycosyltransferase [Candidatus Shapirobacteria bacterium]
MVKINLLGVQINNESREEVLKKVAKMAIDKEKHYIVTPNPEFIVLAKEDPDFSNILNGADLSVPDGIGLIWASRLLYGKNGLGERITGVDLMADICQMAAQKKWSVFLLGAKEGVAEKCAEKLKLKYGLRVLGTHSGWADQSQDETNRQVIGRKVGHRECHFIFVAYGAGKQEKWIKRNLDKIPVKVAMGVGGSLDFLSGKVKRAPKLVRRFGLEWLWRLVGQPWRWRRQLALPKFVSLALKEKFFAD